MNENNKLLESNNILEEKNKILFEDNNRIINENNKLLENNTILEEKNKILFEDNNRITNDNNILIKEKNKIEEEYSILLEEKITSVKEEKVSNYNYTSNITLNDILGGILPVTYYADDVNNSYVYNLIDPQKLYEKNYNIALEETQKEISVNDVIEEVTSLTNNIELKELVTDNIITVEDITKQEKERISNERLAINTISLNDLVEGEFVSEISNLEDEIVDEKEEVSFVEISEESNVIKEELTIKDSYTIKDYKRIIEMLNTLKNHSDSSNISIDDAVSISLISNYSIDDCIKFKEILESNLN